MEVEQVGAYLGATEEPGFSPEGQRPEVSAYTAKRQVGGPGGGARRRAGRRGRRLQVPTQFGQPVPPLDVVG